MKHKNKLLALAAAGVLTVTGMTMPAVQAASDDNMYGDLDGDGAVTISDAYRTLRAYSRVSAGGDSGLMDFQLTAADVNRDGFVTIEDAYYILKYYAEHFAGNQVTWEEVTRETVVVARELYQEYYEPFLRNIKYRISDARGSYYFADLNHGLLKNVIIHCAQNAHDHQADNCILDLVRRIKRTVFSLGNGPGIACRKHHNNAYDQQRNYNQKKRQIYFTISYIALPQWQIKVRFFSFSGSCLFRHMQPPWRIRVLPA